jgi:hypothetical protein
MSDAMFAELMAVTGMANETNRLASGYRRSVRNRAEIMVRRLQDRWSPL